LGNKNK